MEKYVIHFLGKEAAQCVRPAGKGDRVDVLRGEIERMRRATEET